MDINKIKERRKALGYSQDYVAMRLDITQKAYSDIENGKTKMKTETLDLLAEILEITPYSLCPLSCGCFNDIGEKYISLIKYLEEKGIDVPIEFR